MKKILIITECFYPEEFKINDVAIYWKKKGFDIDVLTLTPTYPFGKIYPGYNNRLFQKEKYNGINIIRLFAITGYKNSIIKKIFKYLNFMFMGTFFAIFFGKKYDFVFGFNMSALTNMLPTTIIKKLYKTPTMFWVQDVWPDSVYAYGFKKTKLLSFFLKHFVKLIYSNVDVLAISSKGFENKLKPYAKNDVTFVYIPNWPDELDMSIPPFKFTKEKKTHFTFAGNVGKLQNLENIIEAFCLLTKNYQNRSQLNIIGDGSNLNSLKKLSHNNQNIIFHGKKNNKDMSQYFKSSDFLIVSLINKPIFSSTVPAKTQTYIAAKKPILAIIKGEVASIVNKNKLGISVDPSNINIIKNMFEKCIDMPKHERDKFTINNQNLLNMLFNKDIIIEKLTRQLLSYKK